MVYAVVNDTKDYDRIRGRHRLGWPAMQRWSRKMNIALRVSGPDRAAFELVTSRSDTARDLINGPGFIVVILRETR